MRRDESQLILRMWPASTPGRRVVREHLLDEVAASRNVDPRSAERSAAPPEPDVEPPGDEASTPQGPPAE